MLTLTLLLLLSCSVLVWKRRLRSAAFLATLPLAMAASASAPVTQWLLDRAQGTPSVTDHGALHPRTVIVVLGAGIDHDARGSRPGLAGYSRLMRAAQRYHECDRTREVCTVLASGGVTAKGDVAEADVYARELIALGVPTERIVRERASRNTWQNARNSSAIIGRNSPRVVLVTSGLHLTRSLIYFRHFGVVAEGLPSDRLRATPGWLPSTFNLLLVEVMLHERIGVLRYHLYNRMGWNDAPIEPVSVAPAATTHASPH
ncbi:YdcF family protein [Stenotrophomonas maltophilia]|nr:YdcF family protein [Stenotrophomonas maltophilia]